jgi:cytoskeleton protein RodZ
MTQQAMAPAPAPAPEVQQSAPEPTPVPSAAPPEPAKPVKQARKTETPKVETPAAPTAMAESSPPPAGDNPSAAPASPDQPATEAPKADKVVWKTSKRVRLKASADCWIKIRDADGKVVLSRLLHAGDSFAPPGNAGLTMTVGNAGALVVALDGNDLPALGAEGQVKKVALDPEKLGGAPDAPGND